MCSYSCVLGTKLRALSNLGKLSLAAGCISGLTQFFKPNIILIWLTFGTVYSRPPTVITNILCSKISAISSVLKQIQQNLIPSWCPGYSFSNSVSILEHWFPLDFKLLPHVCIANVKRIISWYSEKNMIALNKYSIKIVNP